MSSANKTMRLMYSSKRFCASSVAQLAYNANTVFAESSLTSIIYGVTMKLSHLAKALLASSVLLSSVNAMAEAFTVTGNTTFTSDYLYRGVSQTSNTAAVQGTLSLAHESGLYFTLWGSSIGFAQGLELDPSIGFAGKAGEVAYDVGVLQYGYPGASAANYPFTEVYGSVSMAGAKVGLAFSNDFFGETGKSIYLSASYGTEVAGIGLAGSVGFNKFSDAAMDAFDGYIDYKIAVSKSVAGLGIEGAYIGSDLDETDCAAFSGGDSAVCEGRFVLTVSKGF